MKGSKILQIPPLNYTADPKGSGNAFFTDMLKHKDKVAQIDGSTGQIETFGSLLQRCIRTAIKMRFKGVSPSDILSICSYNSLNSCVPYLATLFVGAKVSALDPSLSLNDTAHLLKQVAPKLIFVVPEAVELMENALSKIQAKAEIVVLGTTSKHTPFSDFLAPSAEERSFEPTPCKDLHDTAVIIFSSGTSGMPKGICISHFVYLHQVWNITSFGYCSDILLSFASLYWNTSMLFLGLSILIGVSRLIVPKFDENTVWQTIHKHKPTFLFMAPSQILSMYHKGCPEGCDSSSIKDIAVGGGPIREQQIRELRLALPGTRVHPVYGQTEVCGYLLCFKPGDPKQLIYLESKPGSCGTGVPGITYKVVDPETEEVLGPHQQGELRLKTKYQMNGYHLVDSSDAWDSNGWIKTGDIAYYDDDYCFYIVDRIKEMLKYQSWHVQPAVLEGVILTHPAIAAAVVVGLPHETDGDHPMAVVVLKRGCNDTSAQDVEKYVEERVHDRQRLRGGVKFVDSIPTTPTGSHSEGKIIEIPRLDHTFDTRGLGYELFIHMRKHKNRIAQIDGLTGERDTFGSLLQRCVLTAINMRSKGVTSNDVVTLCSSNHLNSCVPYLSALFVGAKVASLDPTLSPADTAYLLKQVAPKLVFATPEAVGLMEDALKQIGGNAEIVVFGDSDKHTPFDHFLMPSQGEAAFEPSKCKNVRDTAIICFSSGTSGLPKGICINHLSFLNQLWNNLSYGHCHDVILAFASPFWGTFIVYVGISIMAGTTRIVVPKFDQSNVWDVIDRHKPSYMFAAPSQILAIHHLGRPKTVGINSLKDILVAGGPISGSHIIELGKTFPGSRICSGYGQTEVSGFSLCFKPSSPKDVVYAALKPGSCGTGIPGLSYKVVDPDTEQVLGPHQQGELRIKTEYQMNGYHNLDASNAWDSEGWLRTGDVAYYDEDECFYIVDRIKEMLKFQSWHVQPVLIENVLITHPDIAAAVVVGIPHEIDGDHPMAVVVLKKNSNSASAEDIVKFVEEKVHDRQRLRSGVKIVSSIPTTPNGKIKRKDIRDMVLEGKL